MTEPVNLTVTVYMDKRDITKWCRSVKWSQPDRFLERTFEITTHAWHLFDPQARYDIYASYDPTKPRDTCVIRQGYVVTDQRQRVRLRRSAQPLTTINGRSWSSRSFRMTPKATIVSVPAPVGQSDINVAQRILANYNGPIGNYVVWGSNYTLRQLVLRLARTAQFDASWQAPRIPIQPVIIPATMTYWEAILSLIDPYALEVQYSEWFNWITFIDPLSRPFGGQQMRLPGDLFEEIEAAPVNRKRPRRVIVRVPPWP